MIPRLFERCLLRPADIAPSQPDLRVIGTFNPGAIETTQGIVLLVRVAETAAETRLGWVALPRWDIATGRVTTDWLRSDDVIFEDARVLIVKRTGLKRLTSISHLAVARSRDGRSVDAVEPVRFPPNTENEEFGVEDPRITALAKRFYFTYVAVSRHGAATALASTTDFKTFERHGIVFPPENKDVVLFPEMMGGRFMVLHRPNPAQHFSPPEIWLAASPDLVHWGEHAPLLGGTQQWEVGRVGAGAPPLRTKAGWLEIYHGNDRTPGERGVGCYSAGALLLDLERPARILAKRSAILVPAAEYERTGFVPNVIFPTGIVARGETVLVYCGASDEVASVVELRLSDLLDGLSPAVNGAARERCAR